MNPATPRTGRGLRRNRDFVLLTSGQLLSSAGSQLTSVAYPLLTLAVTGSAALTGLVGFARMLPAPLLALVAGDVADRFDRRRIMVAADGVRAAAVVSLGIAAARGDAGVWVIAAAAAVEGAGGAFFSAAQSGALRAVVPAPDLPDAVSVQQARVAAVTLAGPPAGGALFALGRSLPFLGDACSYAFSFAALAAIRRPFQQPREPGATDPLRARIGEGFRFLWSRPFLRVTTLIYMAANLTPPAILLVIVVAGRRAGLSGTRIGLLYGLFAAFLLLGSAISPWCRRRLSMTAIVLIELWLTVATVLFVLWPNVYVLTLAILPQAASMPVTDSAIVGYRIAITPDRLLGRSEGVRATLGLTIAPIGPLLAGILLARTSPRATVAVFAAGSVALAIWATLNRSLRDAPALAELDR
jgi:hypothetical protein